MACASVLALCLAPLSVRAGKVDDLAQQLLNDDSYKVRLTAALALGRLGDASAVAPLSKALADPHRLVRASAAESLGRLANPAAAAALKSLLVKESDSYVRGKAEKALAALGPGSGGRGEGRRGGRIYLTFGPFSGGAKAADPLLLEVLRSVLKRELGKLPTVGFDLAPGEDKDFAKSGRLGFFIDGKVSRLEESMVGGASETNCDVKVQVLRWPSKSLILWTNAGAAVQGGSGGRERDSSRRQCLEATAGQLGEDLLKFFQSQGG
jgi:hypothetical protein